MNEILFEFNHPLTFKQRLLNRWWAIGLIAAMAAGAAIITDNIVLSIVMPAVLLVSFGIKLNRDLKYYLARVTIYDGHVDVDYYTYNKLRTVTNLPIHQFKLQTAYIGRYQTVVMDVYIHNQKVLQQHAIGPWEGNAFFKAIAAVKRAAGKPAVH